MISDRSWISETLIYEAARHLMNYNRYLDLHLCTSTNISGLKTKFPMDRFFNDHNAGVEYFYEFTHDTMKQTRYREGKAEGFLYTTQDNQKTANCKVVSGELTNASNSFLRVISYLDTTGGGRQIHYRMNEELERLRYISCMVSIENLKTNSVYGQLQALMAWISDPATVNKLRVNCHGSGTSTGGFSMGGVEMSPAAFVDALVRHGLKRAATHAAPVLGLAHGARWKLDSERTTCENCNRSFSFFVRKHHCRRCGGLFCDKCSSKQLDLADALTGENNATRKNVEKARVCDKCYSAIGGLSEALSQDTVLREVFGSSLASNRLETSETRYGLQQITLALCMGAMTEHGFSPEHDPNLTVGPQAAGSFVRDSLAHRVLEELRRHNLRGIRLSASNQIVASTNRGIENQFGVKIPRDDQQAGKISGSQVSLSATTSEFSIPAYIWGNSRTLSGRYRQRPTGKPQISSEIKVSPCGRRLYFSDWATPADRADVDSFLRHWRFGGWLKTEIAVLPQPGAAHATKYTWQLTPPNRVTQMQLVSSNNNKNKIKIIGVGLNMTKHYKSYEVA